MNATPAGSEQEERAELEELERLLPTGPVEQVLSPGRRSQHKDVLMQLIDRDTRETPRETRHDTRRLPRPALLAACVAVAVAAGLTFGLAPAERGKGDGSATPSASSGAGGSRGAVVTLDRIAAVALRSDVAPVSDGQFVYVRSEVAGNEGAFEGPVVLGKLHTRQVWFSQRPGPVIDVGLIREDGQDWPIEVGVPDGTDPKDSAVPSGIDRPTYAWLASLPTAPDALLELLSSETSVEKGEDKNQAVFDRIGDLIGEQIMPSATAAAVFKATALIPGVAERDDAVDAAGRHGIAIAREDTKHGTRTEWIFNRATLDYLGQRTVFSRDTPRGKAGAVLGTSAVLERAVVDKRGQEPGERRRAGRS
ncbi:CU044_5270 family protein [Streptomyces sp. NPDC002740]